jgi:hypothetical protein
VAGWQHIIVIGLCGNDVGMSLLDVIDVGWQHVIVVGMCGIVLGMCVIVVGTCGIVVGMCVIEYHCCRMAAHHSLSKPHATLFFSTQCPTRLITQS